ncbi:MAG: HD domain-containing protein [Candidatus Micrarchaeota archaeon]|nr:HD domain-containing protein [Candidatus Micrarchaeota archaeon]MDE1859561.1 HD domain-containing protein [Candidatus Micrarchaeota archaeon]
MKAVKGLPYHNERHALFVSNSAKRLCEMEKVPAHEKELVMLAALYHDSGYIIRYDNNEPFGAIIAHVALRELGYSDADIATVSRLIIATSMPQRPKDRLEQIICDADMSALGTQQQAYFSDALRRELSADRGKWKNIDLNFMKRHHYFTNAAKGLYGPIKRNNLRKIERLAHRTRNKPKR